MQLPSVPGLGSIPGPRDVVALVERTVGLLATAERVLDDVVLLLARIEATRQAADQVIDRVDLTRARADVLLEGLEPPATALLPVLNRLAETTSPAEVDAAVRLVDQLPLLADRLETDVLPVLSTLGTVAPDLHDLLDTSRELNEILGKLPGLGRIKRRVEEQQAEAAGEPPG